MTKAAGKLARALFERAAEAGQEEAVEAALERAGRILKGNTRLRQILMHPALVRDRRVDLVSSLGEFPESVRELLCALAQGRALQLLGEILRDYRTVRALRSGEMKATVFSADRLSRAELSGLQAALAQATGRRVMIAARIRKDLLGGLRIHLGERIVDGTLKGVFDRLEKQLVSS